MKSFLTWEREKITQVQEYRGNSIQGKSRRNMPRHMLTKLVKIVNKIIIIKTTRVTGNTQRRHEVLQEPRVFPESLSGL